MKRVYVARENSMATKLEISKQEVHEPGLTTL